MPITDAKQRGRPSTGVGTPITVRLDDAQLAAVDQWIARQGPPFPTRPAAIRRLLEKGLSD
jgi:cytochrome c553